MITAIVIAKVFFIEHYSDTRFLESETEIESFITKESYNTGSIKLSDTFYISENTLSIQKKPDDSVRYLGSIPPPFHLFKSKNNDMVRIIKKRDTLYFKLIDYSNEDIEDPTFMDLIKRILNHEN